MIRFFRAIRQKLLSQNRTNKYFFYALGEVALVVIGILIALQVNNWNDTRKERRDEVKILQEILGNLRNDLEEIQSDINGMDTVNKAREDITRFIKTDSFPTEKFFYDVGKLWVNPHFDPNKSGYNLLVSKGVEIILNDSLREEISLLYESLYSYYYRYEEERTQFKLNEINPFLLKYFQWPAKLQFTYGSHFEIDLKDYQIFKNDPHVPKLLYAISFYNSTVQNRGMRVKNRIISLIEKIENELKIKAR